MSDNPQERNDLAGGMLPTLILLVTFGIILWVLLSAPRQSAADRAAEAAAQATTIASQPTAVPTELPTLEPTAAPQAVAAAYSPQQIDNGRNTFLTTCAACHGQNAQGIQGLGKNLVVSDFVTGLTDQELHEFIIVGRQPGDPLNTTGMLMPPRGGSPALSDEAIMDIVAYLRSARAEQDLAVVGGGVQPQPPQVEAIVEEPFVMPGPVAAASSYAAAAVAPYRPVYTVAETYNLSCAGCHGADGRGVAGLGSNIIESDLWGDGTALFNFLSADNPPISPVEAYPHPVQGNLYPQMTDAELLELIGYLYTLQGF
jgi:disulfide bond formation protein DsbB